MQAQRDGGLLSGWLFIALVATLLVLESLLPGNVFLPLTPDDLPGWSAGKSVDQLENHPHPNWCMSDVLHLFLPGLATTAEAMARGELPLWDPSQALGVPHIDQVHYSVFYPPAWLTMFAGLRGLAYMAWLHLLLAGGGMLLYLRSLDRTPPAALTGALVFCLSSWMTARLHAFPVVGAAAWAPWVLWGLQRGAEREGFRYHAMAAAALALSFLAGFPQISLLVAGLALLVEIVRPFSRARRKQPIMKSTLSAALVFVLGGLLAAPQLMPTAEYVREHSARAEQTMESLTADTLEWPVLTHLVAPDYYASSQVAGPHPMAMASLPAARAAPVSYNRAETSMGVGVMGLLLSIVAILFGKRWTTRVYAAVVIAVMTMLLWPAALEAAATVVPLLKFGSPKRLLFLSSLGMSVLTAGGLDLMRHERLRIASVCWVASIAVTVYALVLVVGVPSTEESIDLDTWATELAQTVGLDIVDVEEVYAIISREQFTLAADAAFRSALVALAVGMAAVLLFRPCSAPSERGWRTRVEGLPGALPIIVSIELLLAAWPMLRSAPLDGVTTDQFEIGRLRVPEIASAARSTKVDPIVPPRVARVGNEPSYLRPNFPGLFGLHDVQAYAPMLPRRSAELLEAVSPGSMMSGSILGGFLDGRRLNRPAVDMLGVNAVFTDDPELLPEGFEVQEVVGHVRVLRNNEALERAHMVHRFHVVPWKGVRLERLAAPDFDPVSVAIVDAPPPGLEGVEVFSEPEGGGADVVVVPPPEADAPAPRVVTTTAYAPGRLEISVEAGAPGLVVISESWHPGWKATVGGREVPVQIANHALLGVPIASGEAVDLVLEYESESLATGLQVGVGGIGVLVLVWIIALFRFRRRQERAAEQGRAERAARVAEPSDESFTPATPKGKSTTAASFDGGGRVSIGKPGGTPPKRSKDADKNQEPRDG